jgi:hypothetical protein
MQEALPLKIVEWRSALSTIWTSAWTVVADKTKTILVRSAEVCKILQQDNPHWKDKNKNYDQLSKFVRS